MSVITRCDVCFFLNDSSDCYLEREIFFIPYEVSKESEVIKQVEHICDSCLNSLLKEEKISKEIYKEIKEEF